MRYLVSLDPVKHADMMANLKNDEFKIQILLTLLTSYRCVTLRQIAVANLALLRIMLPLLLWFTIRIMLPLMESILPDLKIPFQSAWRI